MHYYQFNIKDYSFATIRMTLMEDLAFRRMLDLFYESEKPLPFELKRIAKLIGMIDHQEEIRDILNEFWQETENGWVNSRAEIEIEKYQAKADSARANGKKGGRPAKAKKTQSVNLANPEKSESKANHKPLTNNHKPINNIHQQIADAWNEKFSNELSSVSKLTQKRKSAINGCIAEMKSTRFDFSLLNTWLDLFDHALKSDFLMGRKTDWSMSFDFITTKSKLLKIVEGEYDNK